MIDSATDRDIRPLAERVRPLRLEEFIGQEHLLGKGAPLRRLIEADHLISMIFWGEPGTGKTTLAQIIAHHTRSEFTYLSAIDTGIPELKKVLESAKLNRRYGRRFILFLDEIHRWSKLQQDALLHSVEDGTIILIGATTENPSFEVISPLLSRCRVFRFYPLSPQNIEEIIERAIATDLFLRRHSITLTPQAKQVLVEFSGGDARVALNALELATLAAIEESQHLFQRDPQQYQSSEPQLELDLSLLERILQEKVSRYNKKGEYHYDIISAFIKSLRGSDPDGAIYWLARMIESGEDPLFIARRMVILASEDIGNANPLALTIAVSSAQAVQLVGMPEAALNLAHAAIYLASSPKSNACYRALKMAQEEVQKDPFLPVPLHLRNPATSLLKAMGYGKDYRYDHDYQGFSGQEHLPNELTEKIFYFPTEFGEELEIKKRLERLWEKRRSSSSFDKGTTQ